MKYLRIRWKSRLAIVLVVSTVISVLMVSLELSPWAAHINQIGYSHGDAESGERNIPAAAMYILPFVKELILIGVPMLLTLLWLKLARKLKFSRKHRKS